MTTVMTAMKRWQDEYLSMMTRVEEPVVRYTERAMETIADYVPERPQWTFLKEVPTVTEVVDSQLKFRRRVVDEQAAFVRKMLKAMSPSKHQPKAPVAKRVAGKPSPVRRVGPRAA
ncbi:MAG TPA: hypothetical protein VLD86_12655 [Ilumatobacteraceae bacterium]|jgi:hypothetical protein|nr:hypothetical protein [Ilumatobacteraceae bacterium]